MKVTTQKPFDSKLVRPFDKGGTFYLAIMCYRAGPKAIQEKQYENSDNLTPHFQAHFLGLLVFRRTNSDSSYVRLMPVHFLGPLQLQLHKFDCIIIGQDSSFAELSPKGCRTCHIAGQVRPSLPALLE